MSLHHAQYEVSARRLVRVTRDLLERGHVRESFAIEAAFEARLQGVPRAPDPVGEAVRTREASVVTDRDAYDA